MAQGQELAGKLAVVTGATAGIGKEIARGLQARGATVVTGARDPARGERVRSELPGLVALPLDVASIASVRDFAAELRVRHPRIHLLVNNAGAWFTDRRESPDGYELTFATNVLGPHLLSALLHDALVAAAPARVVNVVSGFASNYDPEDLMFARRPYDGFKAYGQSKQALRMLTWGLAERLAGTGVIANAAAPGFVRTEFNRNARGFTAAMIGLSSRFFAVSPEKGAETPLYVACAPELAGQSGKFFDGKREKDGRFRDPAAIRDLEERCQRMLDGSGAVGGARASRG